LQNAAFIALHHLPGVLVEFLLGGLAWHMSTRSLPKAQRLALAVLGLAGWWALATAKRMNGSGSSAVGGARTAA
jgi:hypothetical protein